MQLFDENIVDISIQECEFKIYLEQQFIRAYLNVSKNESLSLSHYVDIMIQILFLISVIRLYK